MSNEGFALNDGSGENGLSVQSHLFDFLVGLGDDALVLGHQLSEWCGHGPLLEEDIALANIALDYLGRANAMLTLAGEVQGQGRSADDLAYFRDAIAYRNVKLVEVPNGDFAYTIARQFFYDVYSLMLYEGLAASTHSTLAGIAAKAVKESRYHLRHTTQWMLRLGDGTDESHRRVQVAVDDLWMYTAELFETNEGDNALVKAKLVPDVGAMRDVWMEQVRDVLDRATLEEPSDQQFMASGGRRGQHTEYLGHMLSDMQILARSFPNASW